MNNNNDIAPQGGEIIIFQTPDGLTKLDVQMQEETVWLTQQQMALLFEKDQSVIARHILNVFREGELNENSNMQILHNTLSKYKPTRITTVTSASTITFTSSAHLSKTSARSGSASRGCTT